MSARTIMRVVAQYYGITTYALTSKLRGSERAKARHVAMYLVRLLIKSSYPQIGRDFGGFDHTSVIHAFRRIKDEREQCAVLCADIENLLALISKLQYEPTCPHCGEVIPRATVEVAA